MNLEEKSQALLDLGQFFENCLLQRENKTTAQGSQKLKAQIDRGAELIDSIQHENGWFTPESVKSVFQAWSSALKSDKISKWLGNYILDSVKVKTVGVIMAGNIPLVGLHDALCVLLTNHKLKVKVSSKDKSLMHLVFETLSILAPKWKEAIEVADKLKNIDYLIATGSDNSARYFEYYFKDVEKIIRKNRTSVAVLDGSESKQELELLSEDVFTHFGLGCRNVTKVYLPRNFDLDRLFEAFFSYKDIAQHNKYANNYDYNKAVYLMNKIELIENGFFLLKEDKGLHSPLAVLFYEYYDNLDEVEQKLNQNTDDIQCIVGNIKGFDCVPFGKAQQPDLWDYADGIDTVQFLIDNR